MSGIPRFSDEGKAKVFLIPIAAGDTVEITAVKSLRRGGVLIAGEVRKDGQVLKLRDEKGVPLWAGCGPGGGRSY
jgi:hypothetical protein